MQVLPRRFACPFISLAHVMLHAISPSLLCHFRMLSIVHPLHQAKSFSIQFFFLSLRHFHPNGSLGYPDPLEPFCSFFSIIQPFGKMSFDRRKGRRCHARRGIIMLNACRRCCSRAFSCNRGTPASQCSLTIATEMTAPTIIMQ